MIDTLPTPLALLLGAGALLCAGCASHARLDEASGPPSFTVAATPASASTAPESANRPSEADAEPLQLAPPSAAAASSARVLHLEPTAPPARAAQESSSEFRPREGQWEFTLNGVGNNNDDFEVGAFTVGGSAGYFFTDNFELSVRQSASYSDLTGSVWNGTTRAAADWHFDAAPVWPFIGANFGVVYGDTVDETLAAAPEAGLKWFLQDEAFLLAMAEYQFFFDNASELGDNFDDGQFVYTVGFGLLF